MIRRDTQDKAVAKWKEGKDVIEDAKELEHLDDVYDSYRAWWRAVGSDSCSYCAQFRFSSNCGECPLKDIEVPTCHRVWWAIIEADIYSPVYEEMKTFIAVFDENVPLMLEAIEEQEDLGNVEETTLDPKAS